MKCLFFLFLIVFSFAFDERPKVKVYPQDIGIIISMGDSITAATHSEQIPAFDSKGVSFASGGYQNSTSIFNYLRKYNPNVIGGTTRTQPMKDDEGFNVAIAGSCTYNLMKQLDTAIDRMKKIPGFDYENTWKLFTVFSGGNDLCDISMESNIPELVYNITNGLDIFLFELQQKVPKAFVNLMGILDPSKVYDTGHSDNRCILQNTVALTMSCPLARYALGRYCISEASRKSNELLHQILNRHPSTDSFILSYHPMTEGFMLDSVDYISKVDCFHPNAKAQGVMAKALWKSMFTPVHRRHPTNGDEFYNTEEFDAGNKPFEY